MIILKKLSSSAILICLP